jgi:predicted nuclease of predicted toxin-antitoxin system
MHVCDVGLNGASDDAIFRWAQAQRTIVLTFDEDFADARMYPAGSLVIVDERRIRIRRAARHG